jgi:hypothetical protein
MASFKLLQLQLQRDRDRLTVLQSRFCPCGDENNFLPLKAAELWSSSPYLLATETELPRLIKFEKEFEKKMLM